MPHERLPALTSRKLVTAFKRAGYVEDRQSGSHLSLRHGTRPTVVIPVHAGDLNRNTMLRIIRQGGFTEEEFLGFL
jgi:predicted RNA binding protein YcfA (HicA-like mRNA interferase family)